MAGFDGRLDGERLMFGKLIAKVIAAPIKAVVSIPDVLADVVDEVGKALDPPRPKR